MTDLLPHSPLSIPLIVDLSKHVSLPQSSADPLPSRTYSMSLRPSTLQKRHAYHITKSSSPKDYS